MHMTCTSEINHLNAVLQGRYSTLIRKIKLKEKSLGVPQNNSEKIICLTRKKQKRERLNLTFNPAF